MELFTFLNTVDNRFLIVCILRGLHPFYVARWQAMTQTFQGKLTEKVTKIVRKICEAICFYQVLRSETAT